MGLVTGISLPADGQVASTTDYNAAINKILQAVNGGLDDANVDPNSLTLASLDDSVNPATLIADLTTDFIASGGIWSVTTGLTGSMSEVVFLVDGEEYTASAVASKIFPTSQDTYVDVGTNLTIDYTSVGLGAAEPSLSADHVRIARISTDGTDITEIAKTRQGGIVLDKIATDGKTVRSNSQTNASTITPDTISYDMYAVTALANGLTIGEPTGILTDGLGLMFRIKDNGTTRAITWNGVFRAMGVTAPSDTVASKTLYVGCRYNAADSKWDILSVAREA